MTKAKAFISDISILKEEFNNSFPQLAIIAEESESCDSFKKALLLFVSDRMMLIDSKKELRATIAQRILLIIENDGTTIHELSTGEALQVNTIDYLWRFLSGKTINKPCSDLLIDLYHLFEALEQPNSIIPSRQLMEQQMERWTTGLDAEVINIRATNKERIIKALISKIEHRHASTSRFIFEPNMSYEQKYNQVSEWWNMARFHLTMAVKSPRELNQFLGQSLSEETMTLLAKAKKKNMPFFVTPYYLSLLNTTPQGYDDESIRSYILYSTELVDTYGEIKAWEKEDIVVDGQPNAAGWLLPEGHNIHRRYPEVAILIPDSMGRACGGLCASCQRMYDFQSERLNFNFDALKPKESWDKKLRRLMKYFENDSQLRDILITGGDAFMSQNATLRNILDAVYKMAINKRKANEKRPDGEKYAEMQRVRLGSRLLAYLPIRITNDLVDILRDFREKAIPIGITQFYIQTHFQSPLEVTPEAKRAIEAILAAGWTITNQLVYTVAASRAGHTTKLRKTLNELGVVCYYTFSVKGFNENYAVFTPNSRSLQEQYEEKVFGLIAKERQEELHQMIHNQKELGANLTHFLKVNNLPFAATDRSVLNLPAIGKSMTFTTIGITPEGKRILKFDHDGSRIHSPIIDKMGQVYIVENKSIAAYLRQLDKMGEDINEYSTIWNYSTGITEPCFSIYEYPEYPFNATTKMTNLEIS